MGLLAIELHRLPHLIQTEKSCILIVAVVVFPCLDLRLERGRNGQSNEKALGNSKFMNQLTPYPPKLVP